MAIIYTYPIKTKSASRNDLILISDSEDKNKTKQISVAKLPGGIDFVGVGGNGTAGKIPKWSTQYDLTDSSISEDSVTGNIGIGTTSPAADGLEVASRSLVNGGNTQLFITGNSSGRSVLGLGDDFNNIVQHIISDHTQNSISFHTLATSVTNNERMRIASNGDVGIGTPTPNAKLEVIGNYKQKAVDANIGGFTISINSGTDAVDLNNYYNAPLTFSTNNAEKMRINGNGYVGIGNTNPNHKLTVGSWANETNIACASTGFDSLRLGTLTFPAAAGWYRVSSYSVAGARGGARVDLCITGGAFSPVTYSIDYFKSYTQAGTDHTLKLEQYGGAAFITKARIAFDGTNTYIEVYKAATTSQGTMPAQVHFNRLIGESGGSLPMFGTATSGSGSTSLKEVEFIGKGTSVEALQVQGGNLNLKNLPTSATGLSTGDIWNNSGVLNIA